MLDLHHLALRVQLIGFGMIRFGSRTEVFVPVDAEVTVSLGDKVIGAQTVVARLPKLPTPLFA